MLTNKNISPKQVSFIAALLITVVSVVTTSFFVKINYRIILFHLAELIIAYYIISYLLNQFIYRKIKIIYKFISQTKANYKEEVYNQILPSKTIEEVSDEVLQWAKERSEQIQKLESNENFRRQFLMNISHELKTPIFSVQGYIHTLKDGALQDAEVAQKFIDNAAISIDRLAEIVKDLDEISSLESGQTPIQRTNFMVLDLVYDVISELLIQAKHKNITIGIKKGCDNNIAVYADKNRIKQVLINLVENSIKYGKNNGETTIGVYDVDEASVYIEVTDNGIGIAEENINRVFERFYRTDSARSRKVGGSGLGLSIVKHIIEAHNQTVNVRSSQDVGSSFGFTLQKGNN